VNACRDPDRACGFVAQFAERGEIRFDPVEMRADRAEQPFARFRRNNASGVSSRSPSRSSSARIVWLSADGETPICAAARVKLRASATARKASRALIFWPRIVEKNSKVHDDYRP
jgi:hypothetical protein